MQHNVVLPPLMDRMACKDAPFLRVRQPHWLLDGNEPPARPVLGWRDGWVVGKGERRGHRGPHATTAAGSVYGREESAVCAPSSPYPLPLPLPTDHSAPPAWFFFGRGGGITKARVPIIFSVFLSACVSDNPSYFDVGAAAASATPVGRPVPEPPAPTPPPVAPAAPAAPAPPTKPLLPLLKRRQRGAMTTVSGPRAVSQGKATRKHGMGGGEKDAAGLIGAQTRSAELRSAKIQSAYIAHTAPPVRLDSVKFCVFSGAR